MSGKPDSDPRWEQWRAAEATLAEPEKVEPAAASLPPRQGWILRAMAALERGERDEVERLSVDLLKAGELDLACILRLVLLEPDAIDPTEIRRRAKNLGVPNGPGLPRLDLIRLLAVALAGSKPARPQSLAKAAGIRPVLVGLLPLLSPRFTLYAMEAELLPRSRRLAEFWVLSAAWEAGFPDVRVELRRVIPDARSTFDPREWPDLGASTDRSPLERWLATSPPPPWNEILEAEIRHLGSAPRDRRRRILGALLGRIAEILRDGRPIEAQGPICAALEMIETLEGLSDRRVLAAQLVLLLMRLEWWTPGDTVPEELLTTLWHGAGSAPPAERLALARELLDATDRVDSLAPWLLDELALEIVTSPLGSADEALALLLAGGRTIPRKALVRALEGRQDRPQVELLLGAHEVACGEAAAALHRAARLLTQPAGGEAAGHLTLLALDRSLNPGVRVPRRLRRSFELLLAALEEHPPTLVLASRLHAEILYFLGSEGLEAWRPRLDPGLRRALRDAPDSPPSRIAQTAEVIAVLAFLEDEEQGRVQVRELGRNLRARADDPSAWYEAVLATCKLVAHQDPRPPLVQSALDGLAAFLLHRGPAHLAGVLRPHVESSPDVVAPMTIWTAEHRDQLDDDPLWEELGELDQGMREVMGLLESVRGGFDLG